VLTQQLANSQAEAKNDLSLLTASNAQVTTLNQEVTGLNLQLVDNSKVCDARIKVEQDKARKSKWHYFWVGVVSGFVGRQLIK
jgi:hypothetical protein